MTMLNDVKVTTLETNEKIKVFSRQTIEKESHGNFKNEKDLK